MTSRNTESESGARNPRSSPGGTSVTGPDPCRAAISATTGVRATPARTLIMVDHRIVVFVLRRATHASSPSAHRRHRADGVGGQRMRRPYRPWSACRCLLSPFCGSPLSGAWRPRPPHTTTWPTLAPGVLAHWPRSIRTPRWSHEARHEGEPPSPDRAPGRQRSTPRRSTNPGSRDRRRS